EARRAPVEGAPHLPREQGLEVHRLGPPRARPRRRVLAALYAPALRRPAREGRSSAHGRRAPARAGETQLDAGAGPRPARPAV
ncbi:MAG: hypothetical protein AVDCRST_MAG30-2539, partial [uncultured Solirubrobacteraceae bacterium]